MTLRRFLPFTLLMIAACSQDAPKLADLRAESLTVSPANVTQGNTVMVSFVLRNDGDAPATSIIYETTLSTPDGGAPISLGRRTVEVLANAATINQSFSAAIPTAAPPGTYQLTVSVDPDDVIKEKLEDNNLAVAPMPVTVLRRGSNVNLVASAVVLSAATGVPDDVVTVGYTLRNSGTDGILVGSKTEFYLSTDTTKSPEDRKLGEATVGPLGAGQSANLSAMVTIPADVVMGTYNLLVVVNADGAVTETDLNDNVAGAAYTVGSGVADGIDLVITGITAAPYNIARGGTVTVTLTLKNRGNLPTPSFLNRIYLATSQTLNPTIDLVLTNVNVSTIAAGESQNFERQITIPNDRPPGIYYLAVVADPTNVVMETNEDNNTRIDSTPLIISPPASADVAVSDVTVSGLDGGTSAAAGGTVNVNFTVQNLGPDPSGGFTAAIVLSPNTTFDATDRVLKTITVPSLAMGGMQTFSEAVTLPSDTGNSRVYLGVAADPNADQVNDPVRTNNAAFEPNGITISGGSGCNEDMYEPNDTRETAARLTPGTYTLGRCGNDDWFLIAVPTAGAIRATMNIQGTPTPDLDLYLYAPGGTTTVDTSTGIGAIEEVEVLSTPAGGDYALRVFSYSAARMATYSLTIVVTEPVAGIDVEARSVLFTSRLLGGVGEAGQVKFTLRNGGATGTPAFQYEVRLRPTATGVVDGGVPADGGAATDGGTASCTPADIVLGTFDGAALAPGATIDITKDFVIPAGACPGAYTAQAWFDPANATGDINRANNIAQSTNSYTILSAPVCADQFEPNNSRPTAPLVPPGTYTNITACPSDDDFYAFSLAAGERFTAVVNFISSEGDIDIQLQREAGTIITSSGGVGNSETVTYTPTVAERIYLRVYRFSSSGNPSRYSMTITGGATTDLVAKSLSVAPGTLVPGDDLQVAFTVENALPVNSAATTAIVRVTPAAGGTPTVVKTVPVPPLGGTATDGVRKLYDLKFPTPTSLAAGTYTLEVVVDPDNLVTEGTKTNNVLTFTGLRMLGSCTPDANEPNDSIGDATDATPLDAMTPAVLTSNNICLGDVDWFIVDVTAATPQVLTANLTFLQSQGDLDITLYRYSSGSLAQLARSAGNVDNETIMQTAVVAGTYYLKVNGFSGATSPNYGLSVTVAPAGM